MDPALARQLARRMTRAVLGRGPQGLRDLAVRVPFSRFAGVSRSVLSGEERIDWRGCRVLADPGEVHGYYLYLFGQYASHEIDALSEALSEACGSADDVLFADVGANHGLVSLALARRHPGLRIDAFEPDPSATQRLRRNVELNPELAPRIDLHELAVSSAPGRATFQSAADSANPEVGALSPSGPGTIDVDVTSLDTFYPPDRRAPDVVKIDVEGAELEVLLGMRELLRRAPPRALLMEVHSYAFGPDNAATQASLRRILLDAGYRLQRLHADAQQPDTPDPPWPDRYHLLCLHERGPTP